jgi:hypothetical protein
MSLGSLQSLRGRYPPHDPNAAAARLLQLAAPLGVDFRRHSSRSASQKALSAYVGAQVTRADDGVDPPPPELTQFLRAHEAELAAVREYVLANRPSWPEDLDRTDDPPTPNLLAHLHLTRLFLAHALATGNTEDLHAAWMFALHLWRRPEEISRIIAMVETSMIDAAMRKVGAPPGRSELRTFDVRRAMMESLQAETWLAHQTLLATLREHLWRRPFGFPVATSTAAAMRQAASALAHANDCDLYGEPIVNEILGPQSAWQTGVTSTRVTDAVSVWKRTQRFIAQREATDRILAIKSGQWTPRLEHSACSDGTWIYAGGALRFSRNIPPPERGLNVPLSWSARPR